MRTPRSTSAVKVRRNGAVGCRACATATRRPILRPAVPAALLAAMVLAACGGGTAKPAPAPAAPPAASAPPAPGPTPAPASGHASSSPAPKAPYPVKLALTTPAVADLPFFIAQQQGLFAKQGVHVSIVQLAPAAQAPALNGGDVQFLDNPSLIIASAAKGFPFRLVYDAYAEAPWVLVGKASIHSLQQLRGHSVGTTAPGSGTYVYLQAGLKKAGLSIKDVRDLPLGGTGVTSAALLAGKIDSAVLSPPRDLVAYAHGFRKIVFLGGDLQVPFVGLGTTTTFIAQHRPVVVGVIRALGAAGTWMRDHPAGAAQLIVAKFGLSQKMAQQGYQEIRPLLTKTGAVPMVGIKQELQFLSQATKAPINFDPAKAVDWGPLNEALGPGAGGR